LYTPFLVLISSVLLLTLIFGFLIIRQTVIIQNKALAAKQRQEEYMRQLETEGELAPEKNEAEENE